MLIFILPNSILAQNNSDIIKETHKEILNNIISELKKEDFNSNDFNTFCLSLEKRSDYYFRKTNLLERKLNQGFTQKVLQFDIIFNFYALNILEDLEGVIYLNLYSTNEQLYEKRTKHSEFYSNSILFPTKLYEYGIFCSIDGSPPDMCKEMIYFVNTKRYSNLSEWLHSLNPEIVAYGYMGLYMLAMEGLGISEKDLKRMNLVEQDETELYVCEGCVFGAKNSLKNVLEENILNQNYELLKQSGWLKPHITIPLLPQ